MIKRIFTALLFAPLVFIVSCSGAAGILTTTRVSPAIPLIDARIPTTFETATFALG